ncbi:MAG: FAD-binding protein [Bacteroidetes bacterium]|nr:MAG: FAD-binding protein [Bacteroidota bacterium]
MKKRTFLKLSSTFVAGSILNPMKGFSQQEKIKNWAGNLEYSTSKITSLDSFDQIPAFVKQHSRFKVLGTKHCFNTIADSHDEFLSLKKLNQVLSLDKEKHTVTVGSGIRYGELAEYLNNNGYALHNLASLPHISVAGACITATHGSGVHNGNLSTAVVGLEIVNANGELKEYSKEKNADEFNAAVVNLGAMGVITKVSLHILPTYMVRQDVFQNLPFPELEHHFDEIMSKGYSVSLFTDWQKNNVSQIWVKSKVDANTNINFGDNIYGAKPATRNLHPIVALSAENCTEQMGVPGPWHERLPHFKMNFTPSSGKELQSEYFVPREHSYKALLAINKLHEKIGPHLFISEIRTIDGDDLWMSTSYKRPSTAIHFTWKQEWDAVSKLLPMIEEQLASFHPRPHWGKLFTLSPAKLKSSYEKFDTFLNLCKKQDPNGKFRNDFLNRNLYQV